MSILFRDRRSTKGSAVVVMAAITACVTSSNVAAKHAVQEFVREQHIVMVHGVEEQWQLVWTGKPSRVCGPQEVYMAVTCPCYGFAYGEYGKLSLVRKLGGREVERMDLRPLFGHFDYPEAQMVEGTAYVQRWPTQSDDLAREEHGDSKLVSEILHRQPTSIMHFEDYDQDGNATEFLLQVGVLPCGKQQFAAIGVSAKNDHLHAVTSVAKTNQPLLMPNQAWDALLKGGPDTRSVLVWQCGDHGSEVRSELVVNAKNGDIQVTARDFSCPIDGSKAKLVSEHAN
ncbi:MAG TPA: hypothetical protein VHZ53_05970 [Steroidobacteraceae bacterium]|jgi:hypothetical protein|nr:hypothetical protein [Steroidobacteraceae bacterium]